MSKTTTNMTVRGMTKYDKPETLRIVKTMRAADESDTFIASYLNKSGFRTPRGLRWTGPNLRNWVNNQKASAKTTSTRKAARKAA